MCVIIDFKRFSGSVNLLLHKSLTCQRYFADLVFFLLAWIKMCHLLEVLEVYVIYAEKSNLILVKFDLYDLLWSCRCVPARESDDELSVGYKKLFFDVCFPCYCPSLSAYLVDVDIWTKSSYVWY